MVIHNTATNLRHNDLIADTRSEIYYQHREQVRNKTYHNIRDNTPQAGR